MIVGNGDIASAIVDREDLLFFASGVSNSHEDRESEYNREVNLLLQQDIKSHIVYFSSLCVFYSKSRYAVHKRSMESLIQHVFESYTIMRLGNITWGKNPTTLINFMKRQALEGKKLVIEDTFRYIIDIQEFRHWLSLIPKWNCELNCPGKIMRVADIVKEYVYG